MMSGRNVELLAGWILITLFFLRPGIQKLLGWPGIVHVVAHDGPPFPLFGGIIAVLCETVVIPPILLGVLVRPLTLFMAIYTVGINSVALRYWQMHPPASLAAHLNFYKNLAIAGGLLALSRAGLGRLALRADE